MITTRACATVRALRDAGQPVRAITRAVADLTDRAALAAALTGCRGAFVLLPTIPAGDDAAHRTVATTIAGAVTDSGVPHVVLLSSFGADLPAGTGPIRWLHHLENLLRNTGAVVTAIRSPHHQEKVEDVLGAPVHPVFGASADVPLPMVATRDVGAAVAHALTRPPAHSEVVDLETPEYTERQVADQLKREVALVPREAWAATLIEAGVSPLLATELAELYDAGERGLLEPRDDRRHPCTTALTETLEKIL
ncbi:NAD(P)H-binding protein [Actinoplanes sp. CA-252034]|uniref:NAD(P)H-binding protein n=1 Tax=Actinoplanes sp. CA-252034 TaxID=3239906 RepID=UPI003D972C01